MMGPPFDSIHSGVQFAFDNAPSCGSNWPTMAPSRSSSGMSRLDVRAQAGQVQAVIGRIGDIERKWVLLVYGPVGEVSAIALQMTGYVIGRLPTGAHNRRLIADLILWNCGRREVRDISLRRMAGRAGWNLSKTVRLAAKVGEIMQEVGIKAFAALDVDFERHSWLKLDLNEIA